MHIRIYLLTFLTTFALSSYLEASSSDDDFAEVEDTLRSEALRGEDDFDIKELMETTSIPLEKCPGSPARAKKNPDPPQNWTNCKGSWTDKNKTKYVGDFKDGKPHGQGTYTHKNKDKYVGDVKDDDRHGQGTYTWASNGNKYVGDWKGGHRTGLGTFTWRETGDKYVGEWKDSMMHGHGYMIYSKFKLDSYSGIFVEGELSYRQKEKRCDLPFSKKGILQSGPRNGMGKDYKGQLIDGYVHVFYPAGQLQRKGLKLNSQGDPDLNGTAEGEWLFYYEARDVGHCKLKEKRQVKEGYYHGVTEIYTYKRDGSIETKIEEWENGKNITGEKEKERKNIITLGQEIPYIEACEEEYLMKREDAQRLVSHNSEEIKKAISEEKVTGDAINDAMFEIEQILDSSGGMRALGQDGVAACEYYTIRSVALKKPEKRF